MFENFMRLTILFFSHLCILIFVASIALSLYACPWWSCKGESAAAGLFPFILFFTVLPVGIAFKGVSFVKESGLILLAFLILLMPFSFVINPLLEILNSNDTEAKYLVLILIALSVLWTFVSWKRQRFSDELEEENNGRAG